MNLYKKILTLPIQIYNMFSYIYDVGKQAKA